MITQEITRYSQPSPPAKYQKHGKPLVVVGSDDHKKVIYENVIAQIDNRADLYPFGMEFRAKGFKGLGTLINIASYEDCEWDGLKCKPIELWFNASDEFGLFHPSDLKFT